MGGQYARELQNTFLSRVGASNHARHARNVYKCPDVQRFVHEYQEDKLWQFQSGRRHQGFPDVKCQFGIANTSKFAAVIAKLSDSLSVWQKFSTK